MDFAEARRTVDEHLWLPLYLARMAVGKVRPGGIAPVHERHRRPAPRRRADGRGDADRRRCRALTPNLALEIAPIRVNLIAAGFVDTPLSASLLGDGLEARRARAACDAADRPGRRARPTSPRSPSTS